MKTKTKKTRNHKAQKKQWFFTKQLLLEAAEKGPEWNFNRQLNPEPIQKLPEDGGFPVLEAMLHRHRGGQPGEKHIRCMVVVRNNPERIAVVDVPSEFFNSLPDRKVSHGTVWH